MSYTFDKILELIAELQAQLADDPDLSDEQQAALEALLAYYSSITKSAKAHTDSVVAGDP